MSKPIPNKSPEPVSRLTVWDNKEVHVVRERKIKRLTFRNLSNEIAEAFNLNRGLIYTIKNLCLKPSETIRGYLDTERDLVMSPFKYFIFIVGITLFIASLNGYFQIFDQVFIDSAFEAGYGKPITDEKVSQIQNDLTTLVGDWFNNYYIKYQNFWYALTLVFTSWCSWMFFKKAGFNFIEHVAINTFTFAHTYWFYLIMVICKWTDPIWSGIYMLVYMGYTIYVFKKLFKYSTGKTIFRGIMAYVISLILFMLLISLVMLVFVFKYLGDNPIN